jgi:hypothetical protein
MGTNTGRILEYCHDVFIDFGLITQVYSFYKNHQAINLSAFQISMDTILQLKQPCTGEEFGPVPSTLR